MQMQHHRPNQAQRGEYTAPAIRYEFTIAEPSHAFMRMKRIVDVAVASVGLLILLPVLLLLAAAVATSGRPILFKQERIGKGGRPFKVLKFRTMHTSADSFARKPDEESSNITAPGRFLRRLGLDELPQLINVLRGDMTLVGPRPEMGFLVDNYDPLRRLRLSATPGVTGLWQLSPVRREPIHDAIEYDLFYLAHRSLRFDMWIIFRTPLLLLFGKNVELNRDLVAKWGGDNLQRSDPMAHITIDLTDKVVRLEEDASTIVV